MLILISSRQLPQIISFVKNKGCPNNPVKDFKTELLQSLVDIRRILLFGCSEAVDMLWIYF